MVLELANVPCSTSKKVNFSLQEKEMIAIKGSEEQIKTIYTLLVQHTPVQKGSVIFLGHDYNSITKNKWQKIKKKIGIFSQERNLLIQDNTVYQNIILSILISTRNQEERRKNIQNVNLFLKWFNLEKERDMLVKNLSNREYYIVYFLREIAKSPALFVVYNIFNKLDDKTIILIFLFLSKMIPYNLSALILDPCKNFDFLYVNRVIQI